MFVLRKLLIGAILLALSTAVRADVIAFTYYDVQSTTDAAIYVMNSDGTNRVDLNTLSDRSGYFLYRRISAISPDGRKIAYCFPPGRRGSGEAINDIYVMDADGTDKVQITSGPADDTEMRWSPNGDKIVFCRMTRNPASTNICLINADGSGLVTYNLGNLPYPENVRVGSSPTFNLAGTKIAFAGMGNDNDWGIYTMDLDGNNLTRIMHDSTVKRSITWGAGRILFVEDGDSVTNARICSVAEDGTDRRVLSDPSFSEFDPSVSPDGNQFVFVSDRNARNGTSNYELYTMNLDGSNEQRITNSPLADLSPTWGSGFVPTPQPTATPIPTPTATPIPNAIPVVSFQLPHRGIRLDNGLPFEVRVEATDADGNDDIRDVSLSVQRGSDGFFWTGGAWLRDMVTIPLVRESNGSTYYKELRFGDRTFPGNYILTAVALDRQGASGSAVTGLQLIDRIAPNVVIQRPVHLARILTLPEISGTVFDFVNYQSSYAFARRVVVSLRRGIDGKYWTGSRWSAAYTLLPTSITKYGWKCTASMPQGSDLTLGPLYITATAYDAMGNRSTVTNGIYVQSSNTPPAASSDGLSIVTTDSATGAIRLRYEAPLTSESAINPANYAVQLGTVRVPVESIRYESGVVLLLVGADALPSGEPVTVTWRNLRRATGGGIFAGRTTVTVR